MMAKYPATRTPDKEGIMVKFEAEFRSKTKDIHGMTLLREFGGMEPQAPVYQRDHARFSAKNEQKARQRANTIAKEKNMVLIRITRSVYEKRDAIA
ncbi:MAG: hypothetical protein Q7R91_00630 [bacterium]|nr:hypothetical protein [bacterium]